MEKFEITQARKQSGVSQKIIYQLSLRAFTPEGTLRAATEKLDYIASLGVDIVYLVSFCQADADERREYWSPLQDKSILGNPRNPYRLSDFEKIDSEYGTQEELRAFVEYAHKLGLLVMSDLVYVHCGPSDFPKKHPSFVKRDSEGEIIFTPYHFPKLDFDNPELCEYLWDNMLYWIREFDIDGYRCDTGDSVPLEFWQEGRRRIDRIKPSFLMLNEGEKVEYLVDAFDVSYDFVWWNSIRNVISGKKSFHDLRRASVGANAKNPDGALMLKGYENHDQAKDTYYVRMDEISYEKTEAATVISFLIDGVPFLYNGNEFADVARHSLYRTKGDNYRIDWSGLESEKGKRRIELVRKLCELRHTEPALCFGETVWEKHPSIAVFERKYQNDVIRVLINFSEQDVSVSMPEGDILLSGRISINERNITLTHGGYVAIKQGK